jgi:hypothetical protein
MTLIKQINTDKNQCLSKKISVISVLLISDESVLKKLMRRVTTPKYIYYSKVTGLRLIQSPRVKSGKYCGVLPCAIDASERGVTALHAAAS